MGTSNAYGGAASNSPLVPSWLQSDVPTAAGSAADSGAASPQGVAPEDENGTLDNVPPTVQFKTPRSNFSRFARSGGSDTASFGRALSGYASTVRGGTNGGARHFGSSRKAASRLLGFLSNVQSSGVATALRVLNFTDLVGRSIERIFTGLADYVCPDGGTIDQGITREAYFETIVDLAGLGITDLDKLTLEQVLTLFELFATHSIEMRLCNDVGMKIVVLPMDIADAKRVEAQVRDFIRRSVRDALVESAASSASITPDRVLSFIDEVYASSLRILQALGEAMT